MLDRDSEEFKALLSAYIERFNEGIPFSLPPKDEMRFDEIMREALRTGKSYEPSALPEGCIA